MHDPGHEAVDSIDTLLEIEDRQLQLRAGTDANAIEEVDLAYDDVKHVDALDLTDAGVLAWQSAQRRYDERIDRIDALAREVALLEQETKGARKVRFKDQE